MSVEKPYRTNQSSLNKFLEKKGKVPSKSIYINHTKLEKEHFEKLSAVARKAYDDNDLETLARLEAVGCDVQLGVLITVKEGAFSTFGRLDRLQESDKYDNMYRGNYGRSIWSSAAIIVGSRFVLEGYVVAGKTYASKTEFLLTTTPLGKALV